MLAPLNHRLRAVLANCQKIAFAVGQSTGPDDGAADDTYTDAQDIGEVAGFHRTIVCVTKETEYPMKMCILPQSIAVLLVSVVTVAAADLQAAANQVIDTVPSVGWSITIGGGAILQPTFEGSKKTKVSALPYASFRYGDRLEVDPSGVSLKVFEIDGFSAGAIAGFSGSRTTKDDPLALRGMGDIAPTLQVGAFASYSLWDTAVIGVDLRKGVVSLDQSRDKSLVAFGAVEDKKANKGFVANLSADFQLPPLLDGRLHLSGGPRASFFDETYMRTAFGVSAVQSARSGYAGYSPSAGFGKVGVAGSATYQVSERAALTVFGEYDRLVGDAAKSPLVTGAYGSPDQFSVGSVLTYRFGD